MTFRYPSDLDSMFIPKSDKSVRCVSCGRDIPLPDDLSRTSGEVVKCRECKTVFRLGNREETVHLLEFGGL